MTRTQKPQTAKCLRCGRTLTSSKSIGDQMGRTCKAKVLQAAAVIDMSDFRDATTAHEKAEHLIETGKITRVRAGVYAAEGSDQVTIYLVSVIDGTCTCKGHQHHGRCYHHVAARIVEASLVRRTSLTLAA